MFLKGFETIGNQSGLSLTNAFRRVVSLARRSHVFEQNRSQFVLRLKHNGVEEVLCADAVIEPTARRELMLKAIDGRLSGFAAVEDGAFFAVREAAAKARHAA